MIIANDQRIRFAADVSRWDQPLIDVITSASPKLANAADLQVELAFSYGELLDDSELIDVTKWSSVTVALKRQANLNGLADWSVTIGTAGLNAALTFANWAAGTDQHCTIHISAAQNTLFLPNGSTANTFQLVISALTAAVTNATTTATFTTGLLAITVTSATGIAVGQTVVGANVPTGTVVQNIVGTTVTISAATTGNSSGNYNFTTPARTAPVASFPVEVEETGVGSSTPTAFNPNQYYTQAQSDARYLVAADLTAKANLAGATFTGAVILASGQMSGATGLYAATKAYVDAAQAAAQAASVPVAGATAVTGAKTFSALLTATAGLTTNALTVGSLSGVLKATAGAVAGSATTADLTESGNLYFTTARVLSTALTGYAATNGVVAATDTALQAFQKLGYAVAHAYAGATVWPVANQTAMLALSTAVKGDFAFRSDNSTCYVLGSGSPSILGSWTALPYPVASVNGATGTVVLTSANVSEVTNLYFTNARADSRIAAQSGVASGICPLDASAFVPLANLPPLTGYAAGGSLPILATDSILIGFQKLGSFASSSVTLATALAGYSAASGTISSATTIIGAFNALGALATGISKLQFQGTANPGLVVNQLTTSQVNALSVTGINGCVVYDTTANSLKALVNGSWAVVGGTFFPISAGSGVPLTGTLYTRASGDAIFFGNATWSCRTSSADANFDVRQGSTTVLTCDTTNNVTAPNGWLNTADPYGYKVTGVATLYTASSRTVLDFGGTWTTTTTSAFASLQVAYGGTVAYKVNQSGDVDFQQTIKMSGHKAVDASNFFYDSSGNQILAAQQGAVANAVNAAGSPTNTEFNNFVAQFNAWLAAARAHGLIHT